MTNSDKHRQLLTLFLNVCLGPAHEPFHHADEVSHMQLPPSSAGTKLLPLLRCSEAAPRLKLEERRTGDTA